MSVLKTYGADTTSPKPSKTFRLAENGHIEGFVDGREAVAQAVKLMLSTERFAYPIFSPDYGVEREDLIGARREFVVGDIERRIAETLAEDDRITGIKDFELTFCGETANVSFTAVTIFGNISVERGVELGRV